MKWIRLTEPRMRGPEVTRLQEILLALGYDLGSDGSDGIYGPVTAEAVRMLQRKHGLISDGAVGNLETWPFLKETWQVQVKKNPSTIPAIHFVDRRGQHAPPNLYSKDKSPRPWSGEAFNVIRGVTLHQTGCIIGSHPKLYDVGNFHIAVLQDGTIIISNPFEWHIQHAHELSDSTIGIEFQGNFIGVDGQPDTVWNEGSDLNQMTEAQLKASELLFGWLRLQFDINGGDWEVVHAHRQASEDRKADPGSEVWQKIGMNWIKWLGATDGGPDFSVGNGSPIPKTWNPDYTTDY